MHVNARTYGVVFLIEGRYIGTGALIMYMYIYMYMYNYIYICIYVCTYVCMYIIYIRVTRDFIEHIWYSHLFLPLCPDEDRV